MYLEAFEVDSRNGLFRPDICDITGNSAPLATHAARRLSSVTEGPWRSCARQAKKVTCALGSMPAASTASITIVGHVTAASGSNLSDTATVSATAGDTIPGNDTKTTKVKVT